MDSDRNFYYLIKNGDLEGFKMAFHESNAPCEVKPYSQSLAQIAVLEGKIDILEFIKGQGCDLNVGDDEGWTPLHAAAFKNDLSAATALLAGGALVDAEDNYGNTPLSKAVFEFKDDPSVMSLLLRSGANPLHQNKSGVSPYEFAERTNKAEVVRIFHDAGFQLQ